LSLSLHLSIIAAAVDMIFAPTVRRCKPKLVLLC
jgi:hypothetical protein